MIGQWLQPGEVPVAAMPTEQRMGRALMGSKFVTPADVTKAVAGPNGPLYTHSMPITAPSLAPSISAALAPLLADKDEKGNVQMVEGEPGTALVPLFGPGPKAFVDQVCEGLQTIIDSLLNARRGNPGEILAHFESKLKPIAAEHLDRKLQTSAVACSMSFLRGTFALVPLL